jgi:hypothetical protein
MSKFGMVLLAATMLASGLMPVAAQERGSGGATRVSQHDLARSGQAPIIWYYDGRDDDKDFPTNGVFPGDFAADPAGAWIGATGVFGRIQGRYDSELAQTSAESRHDPSYCVRRHRSYDPASGTFLGYDRVRHRC